MSSDADGEDDDGDGYDDGEEEDDNSGNDDDLYEANHHEMIRSCSVL